MPKIQEFVVDSIPPKFQGRTWRAPSSSPLRPNARAADFPSLLDEGITGPIYIETISSFSARNGQDGRPLLYRIRFAVIRSHKP